jgi:hypothetical protein
MIKKLLATLFLECATTGGVAVVDAAWLSQNAYWFIGTGLGGLAGVALYDVISKRRRRPEEPDVPLWHAVGYVARVIGDTNKIACYPDAIEAIRQAAIKEKIELWGQREFGEGMQAGVSKVWVPIPADYWHTHKISYAELGGKRQAHSYAEPPACPPVRDRYFVLKVRQSEIEALWPR